MKKLKELLMESYSWEKKPGKPLPTLSEVQAEYNLKLQEQSTQGTDITNKLGGYADPGHAYTYANNIISKINSAGKTVATYNHAGNGWKWVEGNKALSSRLSGIFDTATAGSSQASATTTTDNTGATSNTDATSTATTPPVPVTGTPRVISLRFDSASDVSLPVVGDTLAHNPKTNIASESVLGVVNGLIDALDDTVAGVSVQDTADVLDAIRKLYKINVRKANYEFARKWNISPTNVGHWALKDQREMIPLLGIINSMYFNEEGISLKNDLANLVAGKSSSPARTNPIWQKNVAEIKKLLPLIR